jgi:hypothetical protein
VDRDGIRVTERRARDRIVAGRIGEADEAAAALVFLASDAAPRPPLSSSSGRAADRATCGWARPAVSRTRCAASSWRNAASKGRLRIPTTRLTDWVHSPRPHTQNLGPSIVLAAAITNISTDSSRRRNQPTFSLQIPHVTTLGMMARGGDGIT